MSVWPTIERFIAEDGAAALVTLAQAQGSSPREVGARMVVAPNGAFTGTIGGGALEWGALAEAQALLARRDGVAVARLDRALGPDLGQCCGGRVLLTIERFGEKDREAVAPLANAEQNGVLTTAGTVGGDGRLVRHIAEAPSAVTAYDIQPDGSVIERFGEELTAFYLFGAGHVGRALVTALAPLPFAVTWMDGRPGAIPEIFPPNATAIHDGDPVELLARAPDDAFVAVMTHSHALDLDLVIGALQANRFGYVGLIGSATKRARFTSAMQKMGMGADVVDRLVCPIGLTMIKDKAPAAIAASVAAQVLMVREAVSSAHKVSEAKPGRRTMADAALAIAPDSDKPPQPDELPLLEAVGITKLYGDFVANDSINLEIWPAEVHALLGENGAGKSTLVKMIYGLLQPSAGEFRWQGQPIVLSGPATARARGIGMVFQHFSLFEQLTVAENVALGLDKAELAGLDERVREVSRSYGLPLEPKREVWRLSVGERQRIEIVRCLLQDPKLLILDEPTSVLTPQEAEQLFRTLRVLRKEGRAILYISHKLEEVRALCDTATILRGGKVVATCDPRGETAQSLASMMVGGEVGAVRSDGSKKLGNPRLVVRNLNYTPEDPHGVKLDGITFELAAGEILGVAGVAGNGQDELFAVLSGEALVDDPAAIRIDTRDAGKLSITERRRLGAAFVPEERLGHATAPRFKLSDNTLISGHAASPMVRRGFIDRAQARAYVDRITKVYDVRKGKPDPEAVSLSGGNLQKYVVGREILREPRLLVVSQPTWGVDAGAAAAIRQAIIDLAARGAAVLVVSQDLDELYEISDRLVVMCGGRLSAPRQTRRADRGEIGTLMAGVGMKGAGNAARP